MKTIKTILLIFTFGSILISCNKEDAATTAIPTVYQEENFLDGYLAISQFNQMNTPNVGSVIFEAGLEFSPLVKGKIKSLVVKLPEINNSLKITLWDKYTETVIKTETVNVEVANKVFVFDINDIELTKNKSYLISFTTSSYFFRRKTDSSNANYPIISGNIRVDGFKSSLSLSIFPSSLNTFNEYAGDLSFNFQQTD